MTTTKQITSFNITWTAEREQYWQGHCIATTDYTHTATGCGETLREAFEDAITELGDLLPGLIREDMLAELISQVKEPEMLDWDIVKGYCDEFGQHMKTCPDCDGTDETVDGLCSMCEGSLEVADEDPNCSVCVGEWHYYVSIDVKVEEN